ncbi:MAG: 1-deoxy-D-xylulose-5-phosphate synthase [Kiritimatiellia bacterium]
MLPMSDTPDDILARINGPDDLRPLTETDLIRLAAQVRELIIKTVSANGGHLAPNLGTVELTIALLKTFNPPQDKLLWDVSHQAYAYKILTGRRDRFSTLRQVDGISGFLARRESPYDAFGAGHAGTALSAALGMAAARDRRGGREHIIAIVGDGSLGRGSSFEALNNLSSTTRHLIVILNDNEMSISANVGAIAGYLGKLLANPRYNCWKSSVEKLARAWLGMAWLRRLYLRLEEAVKSLFLRSVIFEEFGLRYIGPIDGHNFRNLLDALQLARRSDEPILLHVSTQKGRGYHLAEKAPADWHGTAAFDCDSGRPLSGGGQPKYSDVFGCTLMRLAEKDRRIVAITAAMTSGTGLTEFAKRFPDRFFDVGISEEHAVIFAAGLAAEGHLPFLAIYSTFSQRVVDYIIHDVCLQNLPVVFCLDRAGIVGDDGPTHHGIFDIPLLRVIPNLVIAQPADEAELSDLLHAAIGWGKPAVIRYPRGCGPGVALRPEPRELAPGTAEIIAPGTTVQIWALGDMLPMAHAAAAMIREAGHSAGIVNARFIKPLDERLLREQGRTARVLVTLENSMRTGGFGEAVRACLAETSWPGRVLNFGWPDEFLPHGAPAIIQQRHDFTAERVAAAVRQALST